MNKDINESKSMQMRTKIPGLAYEGDDEGRQFHLLENEIDSTRIN